MISTVSPLYSDTPNICETESRERDHICITNGRSMLISPRALFYPSCIMPESLRSDRGSVNRFFKLEVQS